MIDRKTYLADQIKGVEADEACRIMAERICIEVLEDAIGILMARIAGLEQIISKMLQDAEKREKKPGNIIMFDGHRTH